MAGERSKRREPRYWADDRFNQPNQPVVGVSWYEAEAYAKLVERGGQGK